MTTKDLAYYRRLPYTKRIEREEVEGRRYFVARIEELPGCIATGNDRPEALANLKGAFDAYIEAHLHWDDPIPEPERTIAVEQAPRVERAEPVDVRAAEDRWKIFPGQSIGSGSAETRYRQEGEPGVLAYG